MTDEEFAQAWLDFAANMQSDPHDPLDTSTLTMRVHTPQAPTHPRILLKQGREIVSRLLLPVNVLLAEDERDRRALAEAYERAGHQVTPPVDGWGAALPAHAAEVEHVASWRAWRVSLGRSTALTSRGVIDGVTAGFFLPESSTLVCVLPQWVGPVTEILRWHGFDVENVVDEVPNHVDPNNLTATLRSALALRLLPDTPYTSEAMYGVEEAPASPARSLTPAARGAQVPAEVIAGVEEWLAGKPLDTFLPSGGGSHLRWAHRVPLIDGNQVRTLLALTEPLPVPPEAQEAANWALQVAPEHALFLAAYRLKTTAPAWWRRLPWRKVRVDALVGPGALTAKQANATGQPALCAAVRESKIPAPDLPKGDHEANDGGRLLLAVSALARAGVLGPGKRRLKRRCLICGRNYFVGGVFLETLLAAQTDRLCSCCVYAATLVNGVSSMPALYPWTATREAASWAALRVLTDEGGGPPSRPALSRLVWRDEEDLVRQALLRIPLPKKVAEPREVPPWTTLLQEAGVLAGGWRPSRGVYTTAQDGHPCRSMLERHVDDWLHAHAIKHDVEPAYPYDADLNPTGMRADWLIDGVLVEAAGMMTKTEYADRIERKKRLAAKSSIDLIVLTEDDLGDLERVFARWLETD
ncbi:hypothetical protein [Cellulosimicrobium cellulans]|uniref:hypothetical protein n=1 Tax=Cellulosimicrobium cellulans TaxID=1710 RepID=UPI0038104F7F